MKKIFIVEDNEDIQFMYRVLFKKSRVPDLTLAGQAYSADEALREIPEIHPDLLIIDISLPGMDGIELCRLAKERYPGIKVLIVTGHDRDIYADAAVKAGADEIITKGSTADLIDKTRVLLSRT